MFAQSVFFANNVDNKYERISEHLGWQMHLLVVDDDSVTRMTLRTVLTADGHSVVLAIDGDDALIKLARSEVDMIISDVYMPNLDGIRLRNAVRAMRNCAKLPFLFISGYDDKATLDAVVDPRLEGFFRKGKPLVEFLAWIKYLTTPLHKRPLTSPGFDDQSKEQQPNFRRDSRGSARASLM